MQPPLSGLQLAALCALTSLSVSSDASVNQTPDVSVTEGEAVNITCCWAKMHEKVIVSWRKNNTELPRNPYETHVQGEAKNCSTFSFINITREDSGRYFCKVTAEIPKLEIVEVPGAVITVVPRDKTEHKPTAGSSRYQLPIIISTAVVAPLLLITLCCVCSLHRRQARVIHEVPHVDSEESEMDKHSSSSSRSSSQWCQVPVYESVDYFEHVEKKQSG